MKSTLENMFKVGDWVVTTNRGVWQIRHEIELSSWELTLGSESKLWEPQVDEWIWGISYQGVPSLGQYVGRDHDLASGRHQIRMTPTNCIYNFINIQPFIGELPSRLRK